MDPMIGAFLFGLSVGIVLMSVATLVVVKHLIDRHREILAQHGIVHGAGVRDSQVTPKVR